MQLVAMVPLPQQILTLFLAKSHHSHLQTASVPQNLTKRIMFVRGGFLSKGVFEKGALLVYHEMTSTALQARLPCRIFDAQDCELFGSCSQQFQPANDNGGIRRSTARKGHSFPQEIDDAACSNGAVAPTNFNIISRQIASFPSTNCKRPTKPHKTHYVCERRFSVKRRF